VYEQREGVAATFLGEFVEDVLHIRSEDVGPLSAMLFYHLRVPS
jgi:hypothetical protein